jgi:hypothetical protein
MAAMQRQRVPAPEILTKVMKLRFLAPRKSHRSAASMKKLLAAAVILAAPFAFTTAKAAAEYPKCTVGDRVQDRDNEIGTVTRVQSNGIYCYVDLDNGTKNEYYIYWMLKRAGQPAVNPTTVAAITPGSYECYAASGYLFMDVVIRDGSNYTDKGGKAGTYSYDAATQRITFQSGPQQGTYSKYMSAGKIGLSSREGGAFNVVCNLDK